MTIRIRSVAFLAPSFSMTRARCTSTVRGEDAEFPDRSPWFDWPLAMSCSTSRSRGVRWPKPWISTLPVLIDILMSFPHLSPNQFGQMLGVDRLLHDVDRPRPHRLNGQTYIAGPSQGNDRDAAAQAADALDELQMRLDELEENDVGPPSFERRQEVFGVQRKGRAEPLQPKQQD